MSYGSAIDFLALLRQTGGGVRTERMPGLDYVVAALSRAGLVALSVSATAPTTAQASTAWFRPATPSWAEEGTLFLWNHQTLEYEIAAPHLWADLFLSEVSGVVQDVAVAGPTEISENANIVRVMNVGAPVSLVIPLAANMGGAVLISDWANHAGTNNITVTLSGGDVFPNGGNVYTIAGDGGSVYLRPVNGGFVL